MEEKNDITSVKVTQELKKFKEESGLKWEKIMNNGMYHAKILVALEDKAKKCVEQAEEITLLEIQLRKKGRMLSQYIEKYGIVDDIVYKQEE